jgi:hypothetical protein
VFGRGRSLGLALLCGVGLTAGAMAFASTPVAASTGGNSYVSVSPVRLLDTRLTKQTLGANGSLSLQVANTTHVPASATAVAINVTVTNTSASSYLTVYPTGESVPLASNLNWSAGETLANEAIVTIGTGYSISFYNDAGSADVVVDLQGYFVPEASSGAYFVPLTPSRIADTRSGSGKPYAGETLGSGGYLNIQVAGMGGVPNSGVTAAVLHVTTTDTTAPSYLSVYPTGESLPLASNLNWVEGMTVANRVIVPLGANGQITVYNASGSTDVVVDVSGYFTDSSAASGAGLYYPISPIRLLDTRYEAGTLMPGGDFTMQVAGIQSINPDANAVVVNLTVTEPTIPSYFTISPNPITSAQTSDLNWLTGETVANLDVAPLNSSGDFSLFNDQGSAQAVIDASGYFVPLTPTSSALSPCTAVTIALNTSPIEGGNLQVTANATCPAGDPVYLTYWYQPGGTQTWTDASGVTGSTTYTYGSASWPLNAYQLLVSASSQSGAFQGMIASLSATLSENPTSNLSDSGFMDTCYTQGFDSSACIQAEITSIDSARQGEGVSPLVWNSTLAALPEAEREFVVANEERVGRGLPPIAGLTAAANSVAQQGASGNADPNGLVVPGAVAYASNWAEDYGSLGAMFDWMYNDGLGSFNIDCTPTHTSGCWGHRDNILLNTSNSPGYTWVGGTACASESGISYFDSCTLLWVKVPSSSVSYQFTWAQAVADGA